MNDIEAKILSARLQDAPFASLSEKKQKTATDKIMLSGAAISGCALPNTEFFADIIADEIKIMITEHGYDNLTTAEILLALRLNANGGYKFPSGVELEIITFFGNCFNVYFLCKVLGNYMRIRYILDSKFKNYLDGHQ